jgi:hypothetical protein
MAMLMCGKIIQALPKKRKALPKGRACIIIIYI